MGFFWFDTKASMSWVRASKPVAAVTAGGRPWVNSGSTRTARANMAGERRLTFT